MSPLPGFAKFAVVKKLATNARQDPILDQDGPLSTENFGSYRMGCHFRIASGFPSWTACGQGFKTPPLSAETMPHPRRERYLEVYDAELSHFTDCGFLCAAPLASGRFGILLAVASATYDVRHFSIATDTDSLISQRLPWHQRQSALSMAFPQKGILIVVTAATPENAEQATSALERELSKHSDLFHSVVQADSGEFFQHNGILFEPLADFKKSLDGLSRARLLIEVLADDPSLRGVMKALSFVTGGVQGGDVKLDQLCLASFNGRQNLERRACGQTRDIFVAGTDTRLPTACDAADPVQRSLSDAMSSRIYAKRCEAQPVR
jgi:hypothetical protein